MLSLPLHTNLYTQPLPVEITNAVCDGTTRLWDSCPRTHREGEPPAFFPYSSETCKPIASLILQRRWAGCGAYFYLTEGFLRPGRQRKWQS